MDIQRIEPEPPLLMFDDDDWLEEYESIDRMLNDLEYPAIDEVVFLTDAGGHRLHLAVADETVVVGRVVPMPELGELRVHVERFFARWTEGDPPEPTADPREYIERVVAAYRMARMRSKKSK